MIEILEGAYQIDQSPQRWLGALVRAARPHLERGLGVLGFFIDARLPFHRWTTRPLMIGGPRGLTNALHRLMREAIALVPRNVLETSILYPFPRIASASELLGGAPLGTIAAIAEMSRRFGFQDSIGVRFGDRRGFGGFIGAFTPSLDRTTPRFRRAWSRVAAHLTAAMRLLSQRSIVEDATFLGTGVPLYVSEASREHVAALRAAVIRRERACSTRLRAHPDEALELWPALVAGRWSLVDGLSKAGKRTHRALRNDPRGAATSPLTPREDAVSRLLAMGHTNKLVAYELGLAEGTVASLVARLRKKLHVSSRAELVSTCAAGEAATHSADEIPEKVLSRLSHGERDVVRGAAAGLSNAAIAANRGHSVRTTENLLASAYRKLGVRSRAELVARLFSRAP